MDENAVKHAIIQHLQYTGWLVLRVNSGAREAQDKNGKRRFFRFATWYTLGDSPQTAGVADILAFRDGVYLAIETKAPGKLANVNPAQKKFLAEWAEHGGVWCVCEKPEDLALALDGMKI